MLEQLPKTNGDADFNTKHLRKTRWLQMYDTSIDSTDRKILRHFFKTTKKWQNTNEIRKALTISWATAESHLNDLYKSGYLEKNKSNNVIEWKLALEQL